MSSSIQNGIRKLVKARYTAARNSGALTFADSRLVVVNVSGVPFQLRYCPGLAKKPNAIKDEQQVPGKKPDPFEDPSPDLLVKRIPDGKPTHVLVLNKFPIIENHFILATKENKEQTHLLEADDLARTHQCLEEWGDTQEPLDPHAPRLFAFFNSGEYSGASQPHRHVQFLPVEDINSKGSDYDWCLPTDRLAESRKLLVGNTTFLQFNLPFVHFALPIPDNHQAGDIWNVYLILYRAAAASVKRYQRFSPGTLSYQPTEGGSLPISYNLAMTTSMMIICPRRSEGQVVKDLDGSDIDLVALNGTLLGGTLMVKNERLFRLLQEDSARLTEVLEAAGIPLSAKCELLRSEELDIQQFPELDHVVSKHNL